MKFTGLFLLVLFSHFHSKGQTAPLYSNFMFIKQVYNPATVGSEESLDIAVLYRAQWVNIDKSPSVQAVSIHSPLTVLNSSAGIFATNEMQGEERFTTLMLSYAYGHSFRKGKIAFGISAGMMQRAIDGSRLRSPEGIYSGSVDHEDDFIPDKLTSAFTGDFNAGIYFQTKNFYAGISANNLLESDVKLKWQHFSSEVKNTRYYTVTGGYRIKTAKKLYLVPNVSLRTDFVNVQAELNAILHYRDNIYAGASFRGLAPDLKDAFIAMAGFKVFKNLRVGYSYDFSLSSLNNSNSGSHEVYVRYSIPIKDLLSPGKIIYNPRFL
ncbi:MAG TPA: PorP/SprF family type IX secretion system membrane protein [Chitinophagales bacterium]|nr:PorP/SprF family type IX secretion system membrane protein [Chitinophagales bacterium]